ncbi:MAG: phosphotransferase [Gammaproteobacteria bacterium]|nr:phosphotransferase [Gammaproteobacteria bacterium]
MSHDELVVRLAALAEKSLCLWNVPENATARLINLSENATYLVEDAEGFRSILRIHRENYHSRNAIETELAWMKALNRESEVVTPGTISGRNGQIIQTAGIDGLPNPRQMVMFEFVEGEEPDESQDLAGPFEQLGEIAALTHIHSIDWQRPEYFERLVWDLDTVFGEQPTWGDWRDAPAIDAHALATLEALEKLVIERLQNFGKNSERFGLIHADMRLANLLIHEGTTRLIDFDDCGLGWFLYDFAAGISFMEDHPQVPALKQAWLKGYRKHRAVSDEEEQEIDTFVMLRRMALLAWIGSHAETDLAKQQGPEFTRGSVKLASRYLEQTA